MKKMSFFTILFIQVFLWCHVHGQGTASISQVSNSTYKTSVSPLTQIAAKYTCLRQGGWLTTTFVSGAYDNVYGAAAGNAIWLGGDDRTKEFSFFWTEGTQFKGQNGGQLFSTNKVCSYSNLCPWDSAPQTGYPSQCVSLTTSGTWLVQLCSTPMAYVCEIPITTTYTCFYTAQTATSAAQLCNNAVVGGKSSWLATIGTAEALASISQICQRQEGTTNAGGQNYWIGITGAGAGATRTYTWTSGPLGQEANGKGRLMTVGTASTTVVIKGYVNPWRANEPSNFGGNEDCAVLVSAFSQINDVTCTDTSVTAYACENFVQAAAPIVPPGSCANSIPIEVQSDFSGCSITGQTFIIGSSAWTNVVSTTTQIFMLFTSTVPITFVVRASSLIDTSIGITGAVPPGSTISITATVVLNTNVQEVGQSGGSNLLFYFVDVSFGTGTLISIVGCKVNISNVGGIATLIRMSGSVSFTGATLLVDNNQLTVSSIQREARLISATAAAVSTTLNSNVTVTRNTVRISGSTQASFDVYDSAATVVISRSFWLVSLNNVFITSLAGGVILSTVASIVLSNAATYTWSFNTFTTSPSFNGQNVLHYLGGFSLQDTSSYTLTANTYTGTTPAAKLVTGTAAGSSNSITLICITFFGNLLQNSGDYSALVDNIPYTTQTCAVTAVLVPTAAGPSTTFFSGNTNGAAADSTTTTIIIAASVAGGAVLLILLIILICCCCRRRNSVSTSKSKSGSRHGGSRSGGSRSGGSRSGRSKSSRSADPSSMVSGSGYTGADGSSYASGSGYTGADGSSFVSGSGYTGADGSSYVSGGDGSSYASGSGYTGADGSSYVSGGDGSSYVSGGDGSSYVSGSGYTGGDGSSYATGDSSSYANMHVVAEQSQASSSYSSSKQSKSRGSRSSKRK